MESGPFPNKDVQSTFASISHIPNKTKLTPVNENQDYESENNKGDDDTTALSGHSVTNHITNQKPFDIQADQCDTPYLQRTNCCHQSNEYDSYQNHFIVPSDLVDKCYDINEVVIFQENQKCNPLSNLPMKSMINSDTRNASEHDDYLRSGTSLSVEMYEGCDNCDNNQENKTNCILSIPKYLEDVKIETLSDKLVVRNNISDCKGNLTKNGFKLRENSNSNTNRISENIRGTRNSKVSSIEISIHSDDISTLSEKSTSSNDLYIDSPISQNRAVTSEYNPMSKIVSFVTQQPETGSTLTLPGANKSPVRRSSKRSLRQWGSRKRSYPKGKTYIRIVEGVNRRQLWSDVRELKKPALFLLWWAALAALMYISSIYDLSFDISVTYLFYEKSEPGRPEKVWWIISVIIMVSSYVIQCLFAFYEVTYGGRKNFGRLGTKKYSIPLFFIMPWILVFIGIYDTYKNKYTWRLETAYIMMYIEVIFESLPQASLQLNAIIVYAHEGHDVDIIMWLSVSSSILFLSMGIAFSVIFYNNTNATQNIKTLFCIFGGVTVVSRILLCSSWGLRSRFLYALPFCTGLLITTLTWLALRTFSCFGYKEYLTKYEIKSIPMALVTSSSWLTSYIFNCFSPSGLLVSVFMYSLAMVDFYLELNGSKVSDYTLHAVNVCFTTFVLMCNILFSFVPKCRILGQIWIEGEGEDEDDPYHFRFY